jgi:secreted trypsin-like serine protease
MTVKEHNGKEQAGLIGLGQGRVADCSDSGIYKIRTNL